MIPHIDSRIERVIRWLMLGLCLMVCWVHIAFAETEHSQVKKGQIIANKIASIVSAPLFNLDDEGLKEIVEFTVLNHKEIKALIVRDSVDDSIVLRFYRRGGKAIFNQTIPNALKVIRSYSAVSRMEGDMLGSVELFISTDDNNRLNEAEEAWLKQYPITRIAVMREWSVYDMTAPNGKHIGFHRDIVDEINQQLGTQFILVPFDSWEEAYQQTLLGQVDGMMGLSWQKRRKENLLYSTPYRYAPSQLVYRENGQAINNLDQMAGKVLFIIQGSMLYDLISETYPRIIIKKGKDYTELSQRILSGEGDAFFAFDIDRLSLAKGLKASSDFYMDDGNIHFASHASRPLIASIINKGLESISIKRMGEIRDKWFVDGVRDIGLSLNEKFWLKEHPAVHVGVYDFPPYLYWDGKAKGLSVDLLNLIAKKTGFKVAFFNANTLSQQEAESNKIDDHEDLLLVNIEQGQTMNDWLSSDNYFTNPWVVFARQNEDASTMPLQLSGKVIVVEKSHPLRHQISVAFPAAQQVFVASPLEALSAVSQNKADIYIGNLAATHYQITQQGLSNLKVLAHADLGDLALAFSVRKDWPLLVNILNKGLKSISLEEFNAINQTYFSNNVTQKFLDSQNNHRLTMAVGINKPPYLFEPGSHAGLTVDIVREAFQLEGIDIRMIQVSNKGIGNILHSNKQMDAAAGVKAEVDSPYYFSDEFMAFQNSAYTRLADDIEITNINDLKGKKIAIWGNGYQHLGEEFYGLFNPKARETHTPEFFEIDDQTQQSRAFFNDNANVLIIDKMILSWFKNTRHTDIDTDIELKNHPLFKKKSGYRVVFRQKNHQLLFNQGLRKLKENGRYWHLWKQYLDHNYPIFYEYTADISELLKPLLLIDDAVKIKALLRLFCEAMPYCINIKATSISGMKIHAFVSKEDMSQLYSVRREIKTKGVVDTSISIGSMEVFFTAEGNKIEEIPSYSRLIGRCKVCNNFNKLEMNTILKKMDEQLGNEVIIREQLVEFHQVNFFLRSLAIIFSLILTAILFVWILKGRPKQLSIRDTLFLVSFVFAGLIISIGALVSLLISGSDELEYIEKKKQESLSLALEMESTSHRLTQFARSFVVTGDAKYEHYFYSILAILEGKQAHPKKMTYSYWDHVSAGVKQQDFSGEVYTILGGFRELDLPEHEYSKLVNANKQHLRLIEFNKKAMNLTRGVLRYEQHAILEEGEDSVELAEQLLHGQHYYRLKSLMIQPIDDFFVLLESRTNKNLNRIKGENSAILLVISFLTVLTLLFSLYVFFLQKRRIITPLKLLQEGALLIGAGHYSRKIELPHSDEMQALAMEFHCMAERIDERTSSLGQIIDTAVDAIIVVSSQGAISKFSPSAEKMFGYAVTEVMGESIFTLLPPSITLGTEEQVNFRLKMNNNEKQIQGLEVMGKTKKGELFAVDMSLSEAMVGADCFYTMMIRDMSQRKAAEQLLIDAQCRSELANQAKSDFLANMSHEIRTPMNAIIGMSQLALEGVLAPRERNFIAKVRIASESLLRIVDDILDFSKIEADKLDIEVIDFSLEAVLENITSLFSLKTAEKGLSFELCVADNVPHVLKGDPLRLGQILINLANNAVKFTEEGGVNISVERLDPEDLDDQLIGIRFCVEDTGIGIDENQQDALFQSFSQAESSITRRFGGTGLGLAISKKLTEMMNGRIWVESELEKGARFYFTAFFAIGDVDALDKKYTVSSDATAYFHEARVLLVEDNDLNSELATELLIKRGMLVTPAFNGQQALDILNRQDFDLILMDIQMPVMGGYEACRKIRQQERFKQLPIIAMTANVMGRDQEKAKQMGMNDHIGKPLDSNQMFSTLAKYLISTPKASPQDEPVIESKTPSEFKDLQGIDVIKGLEITQQNAPLYKRLLQKFYHNQLDFEQNFRDAMQQQDRLVAIRRVHTLKGVAAHIGATNLSLLATTLEQLCEREGEANDITDALDQVVVSLAVVMQGIALFIDQLEAAEPLDAEGEMSLNEQLLQLHRLLSEDDPEAFEYAQKVFSYFPDNDFSELKLLLENYDFDASLSWLDEKMEEGC